MNFKVEPIAYVRESRSSTEDDYWGDTASIIELNENYDESCITGLNQFSHVEIIFIFHNVSSENICLDTRHPRNNKNWPKVGIFSQRGKNRPNRIGSTICKLNQVNGRNLVVSELDAISGTPIIDIKPVLNEFLPRSKVSQPKWASELMSKYWLKNGN